jgi:signal transduction histidine kinase
VVDECWRPHAALAAARGLTFRNVVPEDATSTTDREMLRIVIGNLLSNAAEYTEQGGWIEIASGDGVLFAVTDSGPEIPGEQLVRIFDRMWRGDASRTASGVHCGIGLSLASALCAQLSLSLSATSTPGRVSFRVGHPARA